MEIPLPFVRLWFPLWYYKIDLLFVFWNEMENIENEKLVLICEYMKILIKMIKSRAKMK